MAIVPWKLSEKLTTPARSGGILASMRIRKKLIFLHTLFSLVLAAIIVLALRPAVTNVLETAEIDEAKLLLRALYPSLLPGAAPESGPGLPQKLDNVSVRSGSAIDLALDSQTAAAARVAPGEPVAGSTPTFGPCAIAYIPPTSRDPAKYVTLSVRIPEARHAVWRLYLLTAVSLFAVYAFVAFALEVFVLPQHLYGPIRRLLDADQAARERRIDDEIIPAAEIPADELGEIMASRNQTITSLRNHEAELADVLARLEEAAGDLKKKNHLLETARRNLADADRLALLGMMSAGIAHELNTPLAVLTGLVEKLNAPAGQGLSAAETALMLRVVKRLEKLSDSLLDFARVRPPSTSPAPLRSLLDEAVTLVRLDRELRHVELEIDVPAGISLDCDSDRMIQVFVNLLRNAIDALASLPPSRPAPRVSVTAQTQHRQDADWAAVSIIDNGPGIDPAILPRLFEPFASTRLDSRGTGLGLAVSEGIVKEHGGVITARNRPSTEGGGAVFEILLPLQSRPLESEPIVEIPHPRHTPERVG